MEKTETPLSGIGGWLMLVAVGVILSPLLYLAGLLSLSDALQHLQRSSGLSLPWRSLIVAETVSAGVFLTWSAINAWLFFSKKSVFPLSILWFIWAAFIYLVLDTLAASALPGLGTTEEDLRQIVIQLISAGLWSAYILKSRRVENTFIEEHSGALQWLFSGKGITTAVSLPIAAALVFLIYEKSTPLTARDIANSAKAAFVTVSGYSDGEPMSSGSGFVIRPDGVIVTNLHVLQGANTVELTLSNGDVHSRVFVLGVDRNRDLALLQVHTDALPSLSLNIDGRLEVGDKVFVLGNPLGLDQTFSDGVLSAKRLDEGIEYLQISAPISEGSSGGPVLNTRGEVVGVATAFVQGGQNLNLAMPAHYVRDLLQAGEKPELFAEIATRPEFVEAETVAKRTAESATLFQNLPESMQTALGDVEPWVRQTIVRVLSFAAWLEGDGWIKVGDSLGLELLEQGEIVQTNVTLEAGDYVVIAVCDDDCLDLDLDVEIPGQDTLFDREPDANPMVSFKLDGLSEVAISSSMYSCDADSCFHVLDIYRR